MEMPDDALLTEDQVTEVVFITKESRISTAAKYAWHSRDAEMEDYHRLMHELVELVEVFKRLDIPKFREHLAEYDAKIDAIAKATGE